MTLFILAFPEEESTRLGKVVLDSPIDFDGELIDGKPERLPKQISRHLFPKNEDLKTKDLLVRVMPRVKVSRHERSITSPSSKAQSPESKKRHEYRSHRGTRASDRFNNGSSQETVYRVRSEERRSAGQHGRHGRRESQAGLRQRCGSYGPSLSKRSP